MHLQYQVMTIRDQLDASEDQVVYHVSEQCLELCPDAHNTVMSADSTPVNAILQSLHDSWQISQLEHFWLMSWCLN